MLPRTVDLASRCVRSVGVDRGEADIRAQALNDRRMLKCTMNRHWQTMASRLGVVTLRISLLPSCCLGCGHPPGSGCERIPVTEAKSIVYVYRDCGYMRGGNDLATLMTCGDDTVDLEGGSYHRYKVEPGAVECAGVVALPTVFFRKELPLGPVHIDAKPGHDYYLREDIHFGFVWPSVSLTLVDDNVAQAEISHCQRDAPYSDSSS